MRIAITFRTCLCFLGTICAQMVGQESLGQQTITPLVTPTIEGMSAEEALVRSAYAKFAYASEQGMVYRLAVEAENAHIKTALQDFSRDDRVLDSRVTFRLTDFVVGDIKDILHRKIADIITPATEEMLAADIGVDSFSEGQNRIIYSVQPHWRNAERARPDMLSARLDEFHNTAWGDRTSAVVWQRYACYSVIVTYKGKSLGPYKAIFVFGRDSKGNMTVRPEDSITDSTALASVLAVRLFPGPLVESRLRTNPGVISWIDANQRVGEACSRGHDDVCCDLAQLQCGPGRDDVADSMLRPLPSGVPERNK